MWYPLTTVHKWDINLVKLLPGCNSITCASTVDLLANETDGTRLLRPKPDAGVDHAGIQYAVTDSQFLFFHVASKLREEQMSTPNAAGLYSS